ncbi:transporter [Insulibacter thermoxylanivorax]|uniref:Transporter n=1 Tax=Insulibacter thermoxylanivorax TaxID=2749268 RepID=A0A916VG62_9BACL|nr:carbohydrate ABC transporter permease [Insulibacter thermoxylanivorax]GFR38618.1 transporter [Insulibacter thermoxylanivorax]
MIAPLERTITQFTHRIDIWKQDPKAKHIAATLQKRGAIIVRNTLLYLLLLSLSFIFLYPLLFMVSQSFMMFSDISDATVQWIPKQLDFSNYALAFEHMKYWQGFRNSIFIALGSALLQMFSCALVGYGFARYRFPGYGIWMTLLIFTFLVPPQTIVVPLFIFYSDLDMINTYLPFFIPAAMGHGLRGALFVLIFIQFFRRLPAVLEEAARIDGAGPFRTYFTIMLPLAKPALLVVFLFSVVWHWSDVFYPSIFLQSPEHYNLSQLLANFNGVRTASMAQMQQVMSASAVIGGTSNLMNQIMAGVVITILPMLILYLAAQRHFVESVERTGIAGE